MKPIVAALLLLALAVPAVADPEVVTFEADDGTDLTGDLWLAEASGAPAVVALHDAGSDRTAWAPLAPSLEAAGITFLAIDLRGHGASRFQEGEDLAKGVAARDPALLGALHRDALAAWRLLERRGADPDRVAFVGAGLGAGVAVHAASVQERIRGAVLLSPAEGAPGLDTMEHLKRWWGRPLLVWSSKEEADAGARAVAAKANGGLRLVDYEDVHGTRMLGRVKAVEFQIAGWLAGVLGAPVAVDGKVSEEEARASDVGSREWKVGDHTMTVRVRGEWLHAVLRPGKDTRPRQLVLAWVPGERPEAAGAVGLGFVGTRAYPSHLVHHDGRWVPIRRKPLPAMPPVRGAWGEVAELLIPLGDKPFGISSVAGLRLAVATSGGEGEEPVWHQPSDPGRWKEWLQVRPD